jgi:hypothetical protein
MYEIDVTTLWAYLQTLLGVVGGVLRLDPQVFITLRGQQAITGISLGVIFVAGMMRLVGQSIVLFANRVPPARFVVRLIAYTLIFTLNVLLMGVIVWQTARLFNPGSSLALGEVLRTIPLAYAPYWLGVFVLAPYLGLWIERGLKVYVFLALVVAVQGAFNQPFFNAVIFALIAWFTLYLLEMLISWPLSPATETIERSLARGKPVSPDIYQEVYQIYINAGEPYAGESAGGGDA